MNLKEFVRAKRGQASELARSLCVRQVNISQWANGNKPIPVRRCVEIERISGGAVRRWHLRPADWGDIWPELIGTDGAPPWPPPIAPAANEEGRAVA